MISIKHKGSFKNTEAFLSRATTINYLSILERYGREGVTALSSATPTDSGLTASSWGYEIKKRGKSFVISWTNSNVVDGVPIAILIQYGHGTNNGGFVQGRDYINPALKPIFDKLANDAWREVTNL